MSSDSGAAPDWSVCLSPAAFMHVHFVSLAPRKTTLAFIQTWETAVTPEQSGEMISQLLTGLLPSLEAALGPPRIDDNLRVYGILGKLKPE